MTVEAGKYKSLACEIDPQEVAFGKAVKAWVHDEISLEEVIDKYPTYLMSVPERIIKTVSNIIRKPVSNGSKI